MLQGLLGRFSTRYITNNENRLNTIKNVSFIVKSSVFVGNFRLQFMNAGPRAVVEVHQFLDYEKRIHVRKFHV